MGVFAYSEAVRHLEQALRAQEVLDPDDKTRVCAILLDLGGAVSYAGEPLRYLEDVGPQALELAEKLGEPEQVMRACQQAFEAQVAASGAGGWGRPAIARWAEAADAAAKPGTPERVIADTALGRVAVAKGQPEMGRSLLTRALDLARELGDNRVHWSAATGWIDALLLSDSVSIADPELSSVADEMENIPREGLNALALRAGLNMLGVAFSNTGQPQRQRRVGEEIQRAAERTRQPQFEMLAQTWRAIRLIRDGLVEEGAVIGGEAESRAMDLGLLGYAQSISGPRSRALFYLGASDQLLESHFDSGRILGFALRKDSANVYSLVSGMHLEDAPRAVTLSSQIALITIGDLAMARHLADPNTFTANLWCRQRLQAESAVLIGEVESARSDFDSAIAWYERASDRPETALTRLGLAELLLEHYPEERDAAIEHLDFAISELREMKMQPSLERALRHRGLLKA
jgi:tetratricopeptide (TPR) repeat protein